MFTSELTVAFPDSPEEALVRLTLLTGSFGDSARMGRIMNLEACPSGLRVRPVAIAGLDLGTFFVPWGQLRVERKAGSYLNRAVLVFGDPEFGRLNIPAHVANRIARAVPGKWPEHVAFLDETPGHALATVARAWILGTAVSSALFMALVWMTQREGSSSPPLVLILVVPVCLGVVSIVSYRRRMQR